ncbi:MAG: glycoside hydrolase family 1 protein [Candidatus Riflebacteria bacterium]|nr:glycoside hydrolase family 1 protein [Candidatus Riflebacteria bacterium]
MSPSRRSFLPLLAIVLGLAAALPLAAGGPDPETDLVRAAGQFEAIWARHLAWRFLADPRAAGDLRGLLARHQPPVRALIAAQWAGCRPADQALRATHRAHRLITRLARLAAALPAARRGQTLAPLLALAGQADRAAPEKYGFLLLLDVLRTQERSDRLQDSHATTAPETQEESAIAALHARLRAEAGNRSPDREFRDLRAWFLQHCRSVEPARTPDGAPVFVMVFDRRPNRAAATGQTTRTAHGRAPSAPPADGQAKSPFPPGFLWGVSTSGFQYEGDNPESIWTYHEKAGRTKEPIRRAADGLHRFDEDLALAAGMGLNAFRTSIEWSRIEPRQGQIDPAGVAYYHRMFAGMRRRGLTPVVTLVHFSWPQWLERIGGWNSEAGVRAFIRHVDFVSREFGREVDWWLTFNEPPVEIIAGYVLGTNAPGYKNPLRAVAVSRAWVRCHKLAYRIIHANDPVARVSWNNYTGTYQFGNLFQIHLSVEGMTDAPTAPATPGGGEASGAMQDGSGEATQVQQEIEDHWLAEEARTARGRQDSTLDFIGVDYYARWRLPGGFTEPHLWEPHPEGLYEVIKNYHAWFKVPVLIVENGMATCNLAPRADGWTREAFLVQHVKQVQRAVRDGIPVLGYIHWSITDNYEMGSYDPRFGLYSVDCRSEALTRVPTAAAAVYRRLVAAGGVTPELDAAFPDPRRHRP